MSDIIIGIDLGTTNSEIAVVEEGRVRLIPVDGSPILPSVVGIADDGALLVGQSARNQYILAPERTIRSVKRRMGEDTVIEMGAQRYSPQEISALILGRLKRAAESSTSRRQPHSPTRSIIRSPRPSWSTIWAVAPSTSRSCVSPKRSPRSCRATATTSSAATTSTGRSWSTWSRI
ncbi:hypothetical protein THIOKS12280016 [Thiocapsa sp. KS1]|nr:hypothetical protein THIOKS12280016 [Thiocapsa sp. KS1]